MYQRHVQGRKRQLLRVLSPTAPIAIYALAGRYTISTGAYQLTPQAPEQKMQEKEKETEEKKKPSQTKIKINAGQSHSHFGAHLKSDMANIRRGLGVIDGLCTGLDIRIDTVEVRGSESVEVVQTVKRDRVLWC